ncbi:hypothetical protein PBY51_004583 [Eleginops maclovinus]|uniref:V-SNARE coiled-coil homology domain-containing protein n=1 Tax=Eleginops maclovinus TaxID=56733 RepID=A0AAN8AQS9_ELEMC|nr:hypothetical protein PBY51_004583 [Eleginops maclovinus]
MENGKSRLQQAQDDAEEVKVIMLDNMNKVDERSEKLGDLEDRAEELHVQAGKFEKNAKVLMQKKRCANQKMRYVFIGVGVLVVVIIIGAIIIACV